MRLSLDSQLALWEFVRHIGEWILIGALVGELYVIELEEMRDLARKYGRICTGLILLGVAIESFSGGYADDAVRRMRAPRSLTDRQVEAIANDLKSFSGQEFRMTVYWDSPESVHIADRIYEALDRAHWSYDKPASRSYMLGGIMGVLVWTHPSAGERTKKAANSLLLMLNKEDIEASPREQNPKNPVENKIDVQIGAKP